MKPTGNKDPFALRRAALGSVRLLTETGLNLDLDQLLALGANGMADHIHVAPETLLEVRGFILDRARQYFRDPASATESAPRFKSRDTRLVDAAMAAPLTTLLDLRMRIEALDEFMTRSEAESLVAANKRIGNILRKANNDVGHDIDEDILTLDEEKRLFAEVSELENTLSALYEARDYPAALARLAGLQTSVDRFFEGVMVMDEDDAVRRNRLALLKRLKGLFDHIADLSLAG